MNETASSRTVTVQHEQGLHARPAEMLARAAMRYQADIHFVLDSHRIDAKSILNILTLGAAQGASLGIEASGPDAEQAVDALSQLVESNFEADSAPSGGNASG